MKNFTQFKEENDLGSFVQSTLLNCNDEQKDFILRLVGPYLDEINNQSEFSFYFNYLEYYKKFGVNQTFTHLTNKD